FDVAELSLGSYVARRSRGETGLVAIPVFPHRRFRHGYAFVSGRSGISDAAGFGGTAVGVRNWQTTAGIWLRGILSEHHGLDLAGVRWVAQDGEDVPLDLPPSISLERAGPGKRVTDMCAAGEIAGLIYPELPRQVRANDGSIRRLFTDPKQAEQQYFARTRIFPIMHVVAIRQQVLDKHPWAALNLLEAFERAKSRAMQRLEDPRTVSLAWLRALQEEERAILGDDPWQYGAGDVNATALRTFTGYAVAQGVAVRDLPVSDLFDASTLETPPAYV
ncbi:MAG: 4,5-dihydroxyphthalate decarboxylase, partial [bacterium]|nr:4,5-dihydroxyphthalate decarboxylase [bacterium]